MANLASRWFVPALHWAPAAIVLAGTLAFAGEPGAAARDGKSVPAAVGSAASRSLPNVEVITQDGKKVHFYDDLVKGKIVLINFFYARCEKFCPPQTANLQRVRKLLGDRVGRDIFMYSITLKPTEDTPEALRHYAEMHGIEPGWQMLTGAPKDIEELRVKLGFKDSDPELDKDTSNHIGLVVFGNDALNRWSGCPALSDAHEIAREISWLDEVIPLNGEYAGK